MLIKVKAAKKSKVCKSKGKLEDVFHLVRLLLGPVQSESIRLTYQDTDGEAIDVLSQEDLDACIEEYRLVQKAKDSDDVRVTLSVADEFEALGVSTVEIEQDDGSFLQGQSVLNLAESPEISAIPQQTIEDQPLLGESEDTDILPIVEESKIIEAVTDCYCFFPNCDKFPASPMPRNNAREDFQLFLIELITETDQDILNQSFPLLFEPQKPQSKTREAVTKFISLFKEKTIIPDSRPRVYSTPLTNASIQTQGFMNRDAQTSTAIQHPPVNVQPPAFSPFESQQPGIQETPSPVLQLFNSVAAQAQAFGRHVKQVFDPSCSPLQQAVDQWNQNQHSHSRHAGHSGFHRSSTDNRRSNREHFNQQPAPGDFSREQAYFLMKLRQYLRTNDIPASVLLWIQANWAREVADKNIMVCYPELIAVMERLGVIPHQDHGCTIHHSPSMRHPFN
jgi:hypothetical protein